MDAQERRPYRVTAIDEVFRSDLLHVRRFTLSRGESIPWHMHPSTHDDYYVLSGTLQIELKVPDERVMLGVGDTYRIDSKRPHHNTNAGDDACVFLLIQGPGASSFVALPGLEGFSHAEGPR